MDARAGAPQAPSKSLLSELREIVGVSGLLVGADVAARATHFWNAAPLVAGAIVRPANSGEISRVMHACHHYRQTVVTHGGLTGLADGDHSGACDIVLSLERMRAVEAIDPIGRTITVEAGCVLERVQVEADAHGLQFGLDLGARGSCTIGGNIATNAGGLSVLRYGMMREQVLGLEAVLADGTIVSSMNRMLKNNAGYDLKHLLIGSEGTLGVVTRAVLRLRPATPHVRSALVACEDFQAMTRLLALVGTALDGKLNAFEALWNRFYRVNTDPRHAAASAAPLARDHPLYAIIEARGADGPATDLAFDAILEEAFECGLIVDAVMPRSEKERGAIWQLRENFEITRSHAPLYTYDISLPIVEMQTYLHRIEADLRKLWPDVHLYAYGHVADGNLHLLVGPLGIAERPPADFDADEWHRQCDTIVYGPLAEIDGSISAEHGIGLAKKAWLGVSRNPAELDTMRLLKRALDPLDLLNPGKIL